MLKCLTLMRNQCSELHIIFQTAAFCTKTMSVPADKPPPLGAFEITPLHACIDDKVNSESTKGAERMPHNNNIDQNDLLNCAKNYQASSGKSGNIKNSVKNEEVELTGVSQSVFASQLKTTDDLCSNVFIEPNSQSSKPKDTVGKTSALMMKLSVTGPPKCKAEQKKTVLPTTLLEGVTELVKQQVSLGSYDQSGDSNKELLITTSTERTEMFDLKKSLKTVDSRELEVSESCTFDGQEMDKIDFKAHCVEVPDLKELKGDSIKHSNGASESKDSAHMVENVEPDKRANQVEVTKSTYVELSMANNESNSSASDNVNLEGETSFFVEESEPVDQVERIYRRNEESAQLETEKTASEYIDETLPSKSSAITTETNPFSEMDVDDILERDDRGLGVSKSVLSSEASAERPCKEFEEVASELLNIDTSISEKQAPKPSDVVYNLSDLFSGELEKRRKRELRKQKKKAKQWKRFSKKKKEKSSSAETDDNIETVEGEKPKKPVPNYFVALQIKDEKVKSGLKAVQDKVVSGEKKLAPALNKISTLHLTMMVLCLETQDDMEKSRQALDKAAEKLLPQTPESLKLDISGIGHFRNSVVFAKVKTEEQISSLKTIADVVEESFLDQEIVSPDQRGFKPHVTIMKLSSVKGSKKKGLKKISEKLYSDFVDTDFGCEKISTLQLCSMHKPKDKQGYYQVEHEVKFSKMSDKEFNTVIDNEYATQQTEDSKQESCSVLQTDREKDDNLEHAVSEKDCMADNNDQDRLIDDTTTGVLKSETSIFESRVTVTPVKDIEFDTKNEEHVSNINGGIKGSDMTELDKGETSVFESRITVTPVANLFSDIDRTYEDKRDNEDPLLRGGNIAEKSESESPVFVTKLTINIAEKKTDVGVENVQEEKKASINVGFNNDRTFEVAEKERVKTATHVTVNPVKLEKDKTEVNVNEEKGADTKVCCRGDRASEFS